MPLKSIFKAFDHLSGLDKAYQDHLVLRPTYMKGHSIALSLI